MSANFDSITIIYNPKSTGNSARNAKKLERKILKALPNINVKLDGTKHAGHAEELAYEIAKDSKRPLIISSSGDGGYNEVINGAMKAQCEGAKPICAVLASGNANDHSRSLQNKSLLDSIINKKIIQIDLLKMHLDVAGDKKERFAHSYIGLGLTPKIAAELNRTKLNILKEWWIVGRTFYKYRPFEIKKDTRFLNLDSIIFANVGEMAKVLTISKKSKPDDGLFEAVVVKHGHKLNLIQEFVRATFTDKESSKQLKKYQFEVVKDMPAQLDGEVLEIKKGTVVTVTCEHQLLTTIV